MYIDSSIVDCNSYGRSIYILFFLLLFGKLCTFFVTIFHKLIHDKNVEIIKKILYILKIKIKKNFFFYHMVLFLKLLGNKNFHTTIKCHKLEKIDKLNMKIIVVSCFYIELSFIK